jgi:hypothetical protein
MNETDPRNETAQDAAEAAKNISTLSDYQKVRDALVADSSESLSPDENLPFEREPMPPETETPTEEDAGPVDAAPAETHDDPVGPEDKTRKRSSKGRKAKDRIDKVVWEREEARKEVVQLRQQLQTLQAPTTAPQPTRATDPSTATSTETPATKPENSEPLEADYSEYGAFVAAKARWAAREELSSAVQAAHQQEQHAAQQQQYEHRASAFAKKMDEGVEGNPEFLATVQPEILNLRPAMSLKEGERPTGATAIADLLMDSENPHSLMAYLSSHEDDFRRISALHPMLAMRELGRIEVGLDAAPNGSASPPVSSQAQPPIRPVGSSSARTAATNRSPADINSVAEWEVARKRLLHER